MSRFVRKFLALLRRIFGARRLIGNDPASIGQAILAKKVTLVLESPQGYREEFPIFIDSVKGMQLDKPRHIENVACVAFIDKSGVVTTKEFPIMDSHGGEMDYELTIHGFLKKGRV